MPRAGKSKKVAPDVGLSSTKSALLDVVGEETDEPEMENAEEEDENEEEDAEKTDEVNAKNVGEKEKKAEEEPEKKQRPQQGRLFYVGAVLFCRCWPPDCGGDETEEFDSKEEEDVMLPAGVDGKKIMEEVKSIEKSCMDEIAEVKSHVTMLRNAYNNTQELLQLSGKSMATDGKKLSKMEEAAEKKAQEALEEVVGKIVKLKLKDHVKALDKKVVEQVKTKLGALAVNQPREASTRNLEKIVENVVEKKTLEFTKRVIDVVKEATRPKWNEIDESVDDL